MATASGTGAGRNRRAAAEVGVFRLTIAMRHHHTDYARRTASV
ncbi:hypothetical protein PV433_21605 [Paenibacillus sp. GYB004]